MTHNLHDSLHDLATEVTTPNLLSQVHRTSRTLRRRRTLVRSVLAAGVVAAAIAAVPALLPNNGTSTPAGPSTQAPTPSTPPTPDIVGPHGYGQLKLGMTLAEATATGELADATADNGNCVRAVLRDHPDAAVWISSRLGVVVIDVRPGMQTPEGIGIGSTVAEVKAAYPGYEQPSVDVIRIPLPGSPAANYTIGHPPRPDNATIDAMTLAANEQDCLN